VYSTEKGKRAVAINKALYEAIHQGFSLQGLSTKAVIPAFALNQLSGRHALDVEVSDYIIKNLDSLMKMSLLDSQELAVSAPQEKKEESIAPKKNSSLAKLLMVFGVLVVILAVVIAMQYV
jgi:hypothetical protein